MRLRIHFVGLLLSCCFAGLALSPQAQDNAWKRYELANGNFSVLFPNQPKEEFKPSSPDLSVSADLYQYTSETVDGIFIAQYTVLGEAAENWQSTTKNQFYKGIWSGMTGTMDKVLEENKLPFRTKLEEEREIKFSGYAGREMIFSVGDNRGRIWMMLTGRQAFAAVAMGRQKTLADQQKFLESFTISLKPIPAVKTAAESKP